MAENVKKEAEKPDGIRVRKAPKESSFQFESDLPLEELTPKERLWLKLKKFSPEGRRLGRQKQMESQMLDKKIQRNFKKNAQAYLKVLNEMPDLSAIDVMKMAIHMAMQQNDYDGAAKWAKELAEYQKPKLTRVENINKDNLQDLSEEEFLKRAMEE